MMDIINYIQQQKQELAGEISSQMEHTNSLSQRLWEETRW